MIPEQLVLLLELLLDEPDLSLTALRALEKTYHLQERDAEVRCCTGRTDNLTPGRLTHATAMMRPSSGLQLCRKALSLLTVPLGLDHNLNIDCMLWVPGNKAFSCYYLYLQIICR